MLPRLSRDGYAEFNLIPFLLCPTFLELHFTQGAFSAQKNHHARQIRIPVSLEVRQIKGLHPIAFLVDLLQRPLGGVAERLMACFLCS